MAKRQPKQTPIQILDERLKQLMSTRLKAHSSGAGESVILQIENMIAETQLDLYTESELDAYRNRKDDDGEQWIV
jgi:hypothetical protein|tara:strand:- start:1169 stop:1393 length:225 start_codon:yes stop_codon:yes gene_type:complete